MRVHSKVPNGKRRASMRIFVGNCYEIYRGGGVKLLLLRNTNNVVQQLYSSTFDECFQNHSNKATG